MRTTLCLCAALVVLTACGATDTEPGVTIDRIVALSDGDHLASTYVDGILAPEANRDLLSTLRIENGHVTAEQIEVPNSVTSAPEVLALSPDGTTAFVTERLGRRQPGDTRAQQLPPGDRLFAVDLAQPQRITATATIAHYPEALAVSPDGTRIAVVSNTAEASYLQLIPWSSTGFGAPRVFDLATLGITGHAAGPRGGVLATNVQWHPGGRALAVNITTQDRVAFFTVEDTVRPWGAPVTTGRDPFVGRFTPDGRHYITSDWGRDLTTGNLAERLPATPSKLSVIRLAEGTTGHHVTATAESDRSAEGLAVNPAGDRVATINMRGTAFPPDVPGYDEQGSVSLFRLDPATGALTELGDYPLDGVLPEGGTFDPTGRYFLASVYQGRTPTSPGSGIQIYRVTADRLVPALRVPLPHGVHQVVSN
ncbi:hypothetical protein ACFVMC_22445 [Nocardia sp. NPDC127579]|uniref:hypothetical protein n=1 Tax=Nocardia sp. NPDC127579 TaxID=3345402 RepID=UPI00363BB79D